MLMLSRKLGEKVIIGEGANTITLSIVEMGQGRCRIGIDAPKRIKIVRGELVRGTSNGGKRAETNQAESYGQRTRGPFGAEPSGPDADQQV